MSLNPKLRDWTGKTAWLIGASSGIGRATAAALHAAGARVIVSARQAALLDEFVASHPGSQSLPLDVMDVAALHGAVAQLGAPDLTVYCAGYYRAMSATNFDLAEAKRHLDINHVGALHALDALLPALRARGQGHLSLVSSVAGYRGLPRSLAYGPSKAALTHLAQVLYLDLHPLGLGVSVIHPGFVTTPMTAQNEFHMPAEISPEEAAAAMFAGWGRGDFEIHFPKRFTLSLKALGLLSDALYFKLVSRVTQ